MVTSETQWFRAVASAAWLAAGALAFVACGDGARRPLGSSCGEDTACESGLCVANLCVAPEADTDGDGLTNAMERALGSDPALSDTDGDGVFDGVELGPGGVLVDTDGDGIPDILESATADEDGDCITDQYDAENTVANVNKSPMVPVVCKLRGVCAANLSALRVDCLDGPPTCRYDDVPGYAAVETTCDGIDENCDGAIDEGLSAADCDPGIGQWIEPGAATQPVGSTQYMGELGVGGQPRTATGSTRYRLEIGLTPVTKQTEAP